MIIFSRLVFGPIIRTCQVRIPAKGRLLNDWSLGCGLVMFKAAIIIVVAVAVVVVVVHLWLVAKMATELW